MIALPLEVTMPDDRPRRTPLDDHPTVLAVRARPAPPAPERLTLARVRELALAAGADDAGVVSIDDPALAEERPHVERALPGVRTLVPIVLRMHVDDVRSPTRSVANVEFHRTGHEVDEVARELAVALSGLGHPSIHPAMAFPMEMESFPERSWIVSHKRVAVAAGLGTMGLHRNVIHPRFGSFVLLGTVLTTAEIEGRSPRLDFDPCISCKLCVAACPVGAIEPDGAFRFSACYTHNYREFMSGFTDFVEEVADSRDRRDFRERVSQADSASMWQSLAYGPNYKAAYCLAVCPAGEDVIAPFLADRAGYLRRVVKPLTEREETIYVVQGTDAQAHVQKRFPHKRIRVVRSSLRPRSAAHFVRALPLSFQRGPARGWKATFHLDFRGDDAAMATVRIDDGTLTVTPGLHGEPDLALSCEGAVWMEILEKKRSPLLAALTGRLKVRGDRGLLVRFARCFPS
ncbi:SCP2 sterol-binding domain-containing protein [Nannocystis punicea]|uniref:SCP2 sterol-binding domain-containing protein n=1 Tax=Nannocystis punicea TaxID=2995304 RepID=A0ABY7H7T1_9BACT|nr:SCP2 sterol-binding domain-containing protein [Nannocystis poenicansa]WAS95223.1 SCP2 sterol-binding domain-containing protein [Nannocystis poenicansa]